MMDPTDIPTLRGERVTLRPTRLDELEGLAAAMAADPEISPWWSTDPATIRRWLDGPGYAVLIVEEAGRTAGVIAYEEEDDPDYRSAGVDIALMSGFVGRGLGTEALRVLARWLIDERGHHRLTIDPAAANARAIHVYAKAGFRPIGVAREYERGSDGTWHDGLLMDLLARELRF